MEVVVPGFGPVRVARGFLERWRGLRKSPESALVFPGSSVHGFGMKRPLVLVGLDPDLNVIRTGRLEPNRVVWMRGARWIVELPDGTTPPPLGTRLIADE